MNLQNTNNISGKLVKPCLIKRSLNNKSIIKLDKIQINEKQNLIPEEKNKNKVQTSKSVSTLVNLSSKDDQKIFNKELLKNIRKKNSLVQLNDDAQIKIKQQTTTLLPTVRKTQTINYKNVKLLRSFLTDFKKIKSRRLTKLTLKQQRQLSRAVKRARMLKLFDPRKTLKPKKFLNFERKRETLQILILLQVITRKNFLKTIKFIHVEKIKQVLRLFEFIMLSETRSYLTFNKANTIL